MLKSLKVYPYLIKLGKKHVEEAFWKQFTTHYLWKYAHRVLIHAFKQADSLGVCNTAHDTKEEWDLLIGTRPQDILSLSKYSYTAIF